MRATHRSLHNHPPIRVLAVRRFLRSLHRVQPGPAQERVLEQVDLEQVWALDFHPTIRETPEKAQVMMGVSLKPMES